MNSYFHDVYFSKHSFNTEPDVELVGVETLVQGEYEALLRYELGRGEVVNYSPCEYQVQENSGTPRLLFIEMRHSKDFASWLTLAACLHIWDLDARGFHLGLWRLHINNSPLFVIGAPHSPYSVYKPEAVKPLRLRTKKSAKKNKKRNNNNARDHRLKNDPMELKNVPMELKNVPMELRKDPVNLKNVQVELRDDPAKLKNDPVELGNDPVKLKNDPVVYHNLVQTS